MTISATLNPVVSVIRKSAYNLIRLEALDSAITKEFVDAIGGDITPIWSTYSLWLTEWKTTLEARGVKADTIRKRWSRLMRDCGVTIPKSDSPEAKLKAEQRAKNQAIIDAMDDQALEKRAKALKELGETGSAKKYEKALEKRIDERKPENVAKVTIARIIKELKALDPATVSVQSLERGFEIMVTNYDE